MADEIRDYLKNKGVEEKLIDKMVETALGMGWQDLDEDELQKKLDSFILIYGEWTMSKHDFYINLTDAKGREKMFSEVTDIYDFIKLKLTALELLITQWNGCHEQNKCKFPYMCVEDYELHRIFVESNNKIISFGFSLKIQAKSDKIDAFILIKKDDSEENKKN